MGHALWMSPSHCSSLRRWGGVREQIWKAQLKKKKRNFSNHPLNKIHLMRGFTSLLSSVCKYEIRQLIYLITPTYFTRPREHIFFSWKQTSCSWGSQLQTDDKVTAESHLPEVPSEVLDPLLGQIHYSADTSTYLWHLPWMLMLASGMTDQPSNHTA